MTRCCFCNVPDGKENLSVFGEKGLKRVLSCAKTFKDTRLANLLEIEDNVAAHFYHRKCYINYQRGSSVTTTTPPKADTGEPAAKKLTRSSPEYDESLCVICAKKAWRKGKLRKYTGEITELATKLANHPSMLNRILQIYQNGKDIVYHSECLLSLNNPKLLCSSISPAPVDDAPTCAIVDGDDPDPPNQIIDKRISANTTLVENAADVIYEELLTMRQPEHILITPGNGESMIPNLLATFLNRLLRHTRSRVPFIGQDIIYASIGTRMPKHHCLAMTIRHWTGSRKILTMLNRLGHCSTYIEVLRIETAIANSVLYSYKTLGVYVPNHLRPGVFTLAAADNIDFNQLSRDGKGTTHGTNMIMFQPGSPTETQKTSVSKPPTKLLSVKGAMYQNLLGKTTKPDSALVTPMDKPCPDLAYIHNTNPLLETYDKAHQEWVNLRNNDTETPTWHSFHARNTTTSVQKSTLAYLPMIDAPATEYDTVARCMNVLMKNTKHLGQTTAVVYMDQAMYSKAKEIQLASKDEYRDLIVMMGGFHITMNFMAAIGTVLSDMGWTDLFITAGIFNKSVADNLLNAAPFSRCLAAHLAMYEAMTTLSCTELGDGNSTSQFWRLYLRLVNLVLNQLYAERTGNWTLYISTLTEMVPVFFATDRQNYARWLSLHTHEMMNLEATHPSIYTEFMAGNFVVNRSGRPFSAVSPDLALEQSLNRDVKNHGGLIGTVTEESARTRWFLTSHTKATVTAELSELASPNCQQDGHHTDNKYDQAVSKEWTEKLLYALRTYNMDPFGSPKTSECLQNIVSGAQHNEDSTHKILSLLEAGKACHLDFVESRLVNCSAKIKDRIHRMNIPFKMTGKQKKSTTAHTTAKQSDDQKTKVLGQLLVASTRSKDSVDVTDVMARLEHYPTSISNGDGSMRKHDKSQLKQIVISELPDGSLEGAIPTDPHMSEQTSMIVDGVALLHRQKPSANATFSDVVDTIYTQALLVMRKHAASRCDLVFDRYVDSSIKAMERRRRSSQKTLVRVMINQHAQVPGDWQGFLESNYNKEGFIEFLKENLCTAQLRMAVNEMLVISSKSGVISATRSGIIPKPHLDTNQEEADTIIILHLKNHIQSVYKQCIVIADDTDVLILLIHHLYAWNLSDRKVWMSSKGKYIPIHKLVDSIGNKCSQLIGVHALSGCDTVSALYGISKSKAYKKADESVSTLGDSSRSDTTQFLPYMYRLYGMETHQGTMDQLRYILFCEKGFTDKKLPPTDLVFKGHLARANLQAFIWKNADTQFLPDLNPADHGWTYNLSSGSYCPEYYGSREERNRNVTVRSCKCKTTCTNRCGCKSNGLSCSDLCSCNC